MTLRTVETFDAVDLPDRAVVVADRALPERFLDALGDPIPIDAGESLKRLARVESLAERILERRSTRPLEIVAVGGGSVGDAVGFLASILWRGVELRHVPTTLLAMVDSAHGGKTAVNLGDSKNQLGTFYPADEVVVVEEALATLPHEQRRDGLAELVKALWLGAPGAFDELERDGGIGRLAAGPIDDIGARLMGLVERAVDVKCGIVDRDPREERGIRTYLNFGHTVAHTLELHTGISHGQAVLWGMLSASWLSAERAGLDERAADRLRRHVHPLLIPLARVRDFTDREAFLAGISRDKKYVEGELRSVLLDAPGDPTVTRGIEPADWYRAFRRSVEWFVETPVRVSKPHAHGADLSVGTSKSEMNRALVIDHLRPSPLEIGGGSEADDVFRLHHALETLETADGEARVYAGEGGTTFRFLAAVAADRDAPTCIDVDRSLLRRPHGPLIRALRDGGATVDRSEQPGEGGQIRIEPWEDRPETLRVSATQSSQYASALALLSADGTPFRLVLEDGDEMPSRPYFEMTIELLRDVGVEVAELDATVPDRRLAFRPTRELERAADVDLAPDASSLAVWRLGRLVGVEEATATPSDTAGEAESRQPDAVATDLVERFRREGDDPDATISIDLSDAPDLGPVLAAVATRLDAAVDIGGAAHIRHKESDRIGDLARQLEAVGIEVTSRRDGLEIPAGRQSVDDGSRWDPAGDHRLAMAGLLLAANGVSMVVDDPTVVAKSYPHLWDHARRLGWEVAVATTAGERQRG